MSATAVILAAGLGTRMRSNLPKVLHPIAGRPMLCHLTSSCEAVFDQIIVVTGPDMGQVEKIAVPHRCIVQTERLGTAHAALQAAPYFGNGRVTILYGDNPLIRPDTMKELLARLESSDARLSLLTMRPRDPGRYGRVLVSGHYVDRIIEWADATDVERAIGLCNVGVLSADAPDMERWLRAVRAENAKGEYYLTDIVALARAEGRRVAAVEAPAHEVAGINSRGELAAAEAVVQEWLRSAALESGVTMTDPRSVFLSYDTVLGRDVTLEPSVVFGPGVVVGDETEIRAFSHLERCRVGEGCVIGPFARLRPGTVVGDGARVGNFVELKATALGPGAKANHLTYLGDAEVGARANIGAGTITCNYNGFAKHRTTIGAGAFIGADTALVAPVRVGDGAIIAAGSVITDDVSPDALAIARGRQTEKPGRAASFRAKHQGRTR